MKFILVTGGAGFIGSCLVKQLNLKGYDRIIIADNLGSNDKWKNLRNKSFDDIIHKDSTYDFLARFDHEIEAIFHLGACSSTTETNANYLLENNYRYSVRLAQFAIPKNIRFIYASSAATYGDGSLGFEDNETQIENLKPLNMYGFSKQLFDLWLKRRGYLNRVVGLKYFNVFGPNEYHKAKMASALIKMMTDSMKTGLISLFKSDDPRFSDGDQVRDFIYVKDVVNMTASFLENKVTGLFNLGSGIANTWNDLATAFINSLGGNVKIQYIDMPKELVGKYQNYTKADMSKWEKAKLPLPQYSLKDAVRDYVQNFLRDENTW